MKSAPHFVAAASVVICAAPPAVAQSTAKHEFVYRADRALKSVHVAGTFNAWNKTASPMRADSDKRTWRLAVPLPLGKHSYKFVLDGETWITDPAPGARREDDGNGNVNSVLLLLPADYARPARPDDGVIAVSALRHGTTVPDRNYDRGNLSVSLQVRPGDVRSVAVLVGGKRIAMRETTRDEIRARYSARVPWDRKTNLAYTFELTDGPRVRRFGANGLGSATTATKPFVVDARAFQPFTVPAWVEASVLYQIFPDRFDNADKTNDPPDVQAWDAKPEWFNRFGGDAAGVRRRIPYLRELGVSAVYFNPVFQSPSNHRYDAEDFKKIDPQFGTNAEFAALTRDLRKSGIRTVMDFVFNHSATTFAPFADIRKNGASSPFKDWYFIQSFPVRTEGTPNYAAWYGFASMPKMNVLNPATRDYLLGLVDFWKRDVPLAGMRLDVANEVDPRFWRLLRATAKKKDPNLWIVGEVWGDGSPWLTGDQWDSVMNYPFRDACLRFFAEEKTRPSEFAARLMANYNGYAPQVSRNLMNLLSSHDTPRFLTACGGNADRHRLAATVQFTWVGAPSIYYGEEIGMEGGADPDNRRGMRWDRATGDNEMLAFYKKLIAIRRASPALQSGDPEILATDDDAGTVAFSRVLGGDAVVVALNRSPQPRTIRLTLPQPMRRATRIVDALTGRTFAISEPSIAIPLPARSAVILQPKR